MIYFVHIPKTGGTSIRRLFAESYDPAEIAYIYSPPHGLTIRGLLELPEDRRRGLKVVYGHFPYGLHRRLGIAGGYATCFRGCKERIVSTYFHHVRDGFVHDRSLLQYLQEAKPKDMDNYSVRLLSGVGHEVEFGGVTRHHLYRAIYNLGAAFEVFGLTERIGATVSLLLRNFRLSDCRIGHENVTPKKMAENGLDSGEVDAVIRMNELDQELYGFARMRFNALLTEV